MECVSRESEIKIKIIQININIDYVDHVIDRELYFNLQLAKMFGDMTFMFLALLMLPVEMWVTIFRYLDNKTLLSTALASKRFMGVCKGDPILRRRVRTQILLENRALGREMGVAIIYNYVPGVTYVDQNKLAIIERLPILRIQQNSRLNYFTVDTKDSRRIGGGKQSKKSSKFRSNPYKCLRL
ncbi:hypothetical protein FQA39_LY11606 [Lamprigera yunnana]|nr:hypothetical protein FQA39_LY11606 [Lamprigera yunnana]